MKAKCIFSTSLSLTYSRKCFPSFQFLQIPLNPPPLLQFSFPPTRESPPFLPFSLFLFSLSHVSTNFLHKSYLFLARHVMSKNSPLLICHVASNSDFIFNSLINFKYSLISYSLSLKKTFFILIRNFNQFNLKTILFIFMIKASQNWINYS